jgi:ribosomal-protein-alanine N-acetyltransferase
MCPLYRPEADAAVNYHGAAGSLATTDWQRRLPVLTSGSLILRELELRDAASLLAMLTTEEVTRFISPPPATVDGFERFIGWTLQQRMTGTSICFGVVPKGMATPIGLFQLRSLDDGLSTSEWGFAYGWPFWGTGLFVEGAHQVLDFAFNVLKLHRLEARAAVQNRRGNAALRKLGAVREGTLRGSFLRHGKYHDQTIWAILHTDWSRTKTRSSRERGLAVH